VLQWMGWPARWDAGLLCGSPVLKEKQRSSGVVFEGGANATVNVFDLRSASPRRRRKVFVGSATGHGMGSRGNMSLSGGTRDGLSIVAVLRKRGRTQ
jgi:hypothetical protein